jgi:mono/diheme cytochrome c family protein
MNLSSSRHRARTLAALAVAMALCAPVAAEAPEPPPMPDEGNLGTVDGAQVYAQVCQGCHMADGRGADGGGAYPSFRDNPNVASATFLAVVILHGRRNMPAFAPELAPAPFFEPVVLSDVQVAAVVNHIRTSFGNDYRDPITAADVAALHPPQGEPTP